MKRIALLMTVMLLLVTTAMAQSSSRWGVTLGANINSIHFKQSDIMPSKSCWGPQAGVMGEMNFSGLGFGVDGSLLYSMRQGKLNYGERVAWSSLGAGNETVAMHYLDVPLHLKFQFRRLGGMETTFMPLAYVGPHFSFLVHGSHSNLNSYPFVNVYLDMGAGFELFERWQVRGGYKFSVGQSLHTKLLDDNVAKNRNWYFSLTYFLK